MAVKEKHLGIGISTAQGDYENTLQIQNYNP